MIRFWQKVDRRSDDECWPWLGTKIRNGYGRITINGQKKLAHRVSYEIHYGPIPEGFTVDHVKDRGCVLRECTNPRHLEAVTGKENTLRGNSFSAVNAKKTHCIHGHPLSGPNLAVHVFSDGRRMRICRSCNNAVHRRKYAKSRKR
jgi:hypothetical protein